jgi:uncharacterized membrane protein
MRRLRKLFRLFRDFCSNKSFLHGIGQVGSFVAKVLSVVIVAVILVALGDLIILLVQELCSSPVSFFNKRLFIIFGLFLNILIALELLENIKFKILNSCVHQNQSNPKSNDSFFQL